MICEHQESRKRTFYVSNCPFIKSLPGHTLFAWPCFVLGAPDCTKFTGKAMGVQDFTGDGNWMRNKMCYSRKTIAFMYNAFSLGFLLGTWKYVLMQEANLKPQTKWSTKCAKDRSYAPPHKEKQNKPNWGFMNTVGYPCVSWFLWCIGKSNVLRHHSIPVTF